MSAASRPLIAESMTRDGGAYSVAHIVPFDHDITEAEFRAWLEANDWLGYPPAGYGPVSITVIGCVGTYRTAAPCD